MTNNSRIITAIIIVALLGAGIFYYIQTGGVGADTPTLDTVKTSTDIVRPISSWETKPQSAGRGDVIQGESFDVGSGVSRVSVQLQRISDGAIWDGSHWQQSAGDATDAKLEGSNFSYTIPTDLIANDKYILRSQAIDAAGNAQVDWAEFQFSGKDTGNSSSI